MWGAICVRGRHAAMFGRPEQFFGAGNARLPCLLYVLLHGYIVLLALRKPRQQTQQRLNRCQMSILIRRMKVIAMRTIAGDSRYTAPVKPALTVPLGLWNAKDDQYRYVDIITTRC